MVILHIAYLKGLKSNGINVVVPKHVEFQRKNGHDAKLLNTYNLIIDENCIDYEYNKTFSFSKLPLPFNKPDIIVFHELYYKQYIRLFNLAIKEKIPYVIIPHGCLTTTAQNRKKIKKYIGNLLIFNRFIKKSLGLQMLSLNEKNNTRVNKNKFIATNGVQFPVNKKKLFNNECIRITYIGRFNIFIKGIDLLLDSVYQLKDYLISSKSYISLYGPKNADYEIIEKKINEMNLSNIVSINGPLFDAEKEKIILQSDIFIQTSRTEGMPLGILEALSYGVPCIITKGTGLCNLVDSYNAGWTAECEVSSIVSSIRTAINDKDKYFELSENALQLINDNFDWNIIVENTINEYKKLLNQ